MGTIQYIAIHCLVRVIAPATQRCQDISHMSAFLDRTLVDDGLSCGAETVFETHPSHLLLPFRSPRNIAAVAVGAAAAAGVAWYFFSRPKLSEEEIERNRRDLLASVGRITDGSITDISMTQGDSVPAPRVIIYEYRIAGVSYECGQNVMGLVDHAGDIRIDLPIQVRYDPHNPADSIVVSESWNGLRFTPMHARADEKDDSVS